MSISELWKDMTMRNVCAYLLKSLLVMGLFSGCTTEKEPPAPAKVPLVQTEAPPAPLKVPLNPVEEFMKNNAPPVPAKILQTAPKYYSTLQSTECIVLEFDKRPENFRTELPLEFCFADEVESQLGKGDFENLQNLENLEGPLSHSETSVYIRVPNTVSKRPKNSVWIFRAYWGHEETSWGTEIPHPSLELIYVISETDPAKEYVEAPEKLSADVLLGIEVPPGPAILLQLTPKNHSTLDMWVGGIVLIFNKKPVNFKTDPPLDFCFVHEAESKFGKGVRQILDHLEMFEGHISAFSLLGASMYISVPNSIHRGSRLEDRFWVFEASWGTEVPQRTVRLTYVIANL
jgi:hypothetical protein